MPVGAQTITPSAPLNHVSRASSCTGYGGYGMVTSPSFRATYAAWLERGGVLAWAHVRGGGEFGRAWYDAAILDR